jgi:hypothetical protein
MSGTVRREPSLAGCNGAPGLCLRTNAVERFMRSVTLNCNRTRMKTMTTTRCRRRTAASLLMAMSAMMTVYGALADDLWRALSGGKPDLYLRYRFENVDDGQTPALTDAYANTLRSALGYSTGLYYDFGLYAQLEDVRVLGDEDFNDGGGNGYGTRAIVVDPEGTEIQQANLRYRGLPKTQLWLGRQEIEHRQAPLHRYAGNVLWRQNWQTFDALRMVNDSVPALHIDYAYVWNVNRIFGEDNHVPDRADYSLDGHLIDLTYRGIPYSTLEPYAYLLDFGDNRLAPTRALSSATYGARLQGAYDVVSWAAKILYTGEFAHQEDYGHDNPVKISVNYYLGELGVSKLFNNPWLESVTLKGSYEVLGGDGAVPVGKGKIGRAFQTPLGTNHAFQGWADRFLTTPADGVVDIYGTLAFKIAGANLSLIYHDFSADHGDYNYGSEWDVQLSRPILEHYTVGIKYARYDASSNATNLARNGPASAGKQAYDLNKLWLWAELKF